MSTTNVTVEDLYKPTGLNTHQLQDPEVAHIVVHHNKVLGAQLVPGLEVDVKELSDGISAIINVKEGAQIKKPVHMCFGMMPEEGLQRIELDVRIDPEARVAIQAHCVFPYAVNIVHRMDAQIRVAEGAHYSYFERHVHGDKGGVLVLPKAVVELEKNARFKTEFELLKGRVGKIDINYETTCQAFSVMEMTARINGTGDDDIQIHETGYLVGEGARGVLTSRIAVRQNARANVYNKLIASAPYARGHVDCKEIVQDNAVANAVPIVEVSHPKAHVTHEAAIGSVDNKQLETLMSRGLNEDEASELIIQGLLT